jgi:ABC-type lipoprotein export system ATPase subunit
VIDIDDAFVLHRGRTRDVAALRGMSLRVGIGERIVVRGPSGSGKSTLVAALTAEVRASAGRVLLFGHDMAQIDHAAAVKLRTAHVGVVSQRSGLDLLDDLICLDNVALQSRLSESSRDAGRAAALQTLAELGLDHLAGRRPGTLSGGERQRVALAAALAHGPGLVIADEPTGELDAVSADQVYDFLRDHAEQTGAALLVVTHDERAERIASRVVTIHDGRLSQERQDGRDTLVVDRRGWVRLPDALRADAGVAERAVAASEAGRITLTGSGPAGGVDTAADVDSARAGEIAVVVDDAKIQLGAVTVGPVSMELRRGQVTVVTGRSGSGKTSLVSVVLGLIEPTSGDVRRHIDSYACAPQTAAFADQQSVAANVDLVRALRGLAPLDLDHGVLDALGMAGLEGRTAGALSGGERQRLAVARALSAAADLVVLDEPTSQLDRSTARLVADAVRRVADLGSCVVCASHDEELIAVADQVVDLGAAHTPFGVPC